MKIKSASSVARTLVTVLACTAVSFMSAAPALAGNAEDEFVKRIRRAYAIADTQQRKEALLELFYLEGSPEDIVAMYRDRIVAKHMMDYENPAIGFAPLPEDFNPEYVLNGVEYRPNLPLEGYVTLDENMKVTYGRHEGTLYFAGVTKKVVVEDAPEDIMLQVLVMGPGNPDPVKFSGTCTMLQSNLKEKKFIVEDMGHGNSTTLYMGQRITQCSITRTSEHGWIRIMILEGDNEVFNSGQVEKPGPVIYDGTGTGARGGS